MRIMSLFLILVSSLLMPYQAYASDDFLSRLSLSDKTCRVTLQEAEDSAVKNSYTIAAQKNIVESIKSEEYATKVKQLPTLGFNAQSQFTQKVGRISVPQLNINQEVGDHKSWSVGPVVDWVVWDSGQIYKKSKSLRASAASEGQILDVDERQVVLNVSSAYAGLQLAKEQVRLVRESLDLARAQYRYVLDRKNAGTADLFDATVAHQEVVDREKDLEEARGELAIRKRVLFAAMGFDPTMKGVDLIDVDPIGTVLAEYLPKSNEGVVVNTHPQVVALSLKRESLELAASSVIRGHFPKLVLQGKATYEYPNMGRLDTIQQNSLYLGLDFPIFDWGSIGKESKSYKYKAKAAEEQKNQVIIDLSRELSEIRERIETFKSLRIANSKVVRDAVLVAQLAYDSYKAGRIIFLDVQRANVKALSAKVSAARNDAELIIEIAKLLSLAEPEGDLR